MPDASALAATLVRDLLQLLQPYKAVQVCALHNTLLRTAAVPAVATTLVCLLLYAASVLPPAHSLLLPVCLTTATPMQPPPPDLPCAPQDTLLPCCTLIN